MKATTKAPVKVRQKARPVAIVVDGKRGSRKKVFLDGDEK